MSETTIAALATAPAPAGVAIVRISGPATKKALKATFRSTQNPIDEPRKLFFGEIKDHRNDSIIDHGMAVFMPGPNSFTGEDVAEFHLHGSPLLASKLLRSLFGLGIAPAEPGEFSKRAYLNSKMDLVQAEAICDLIEATSERALEIASEQLGGKLSHVLDKVGEPLRDTLAELEAQIDFPEEDISPDTYTTLQGKILKAKNELSSLLGTYKYGDYVKEGFKVLLCGAPNAGKSSLLNSLLNRKRAIVTSISGTTRDLLEEEALFDGYKFIFCDSAGLTETDDEVEKIGIELALERLQWADLVLLVVDATSEDNIWQKALKLIEGKSKKIWMIVNKIDIAPDAIGKIVCPGDTCRQNFYISAETNDGLSGLKESLVSEVSTLKSNLGEDSAIITRERHRSAITSSQESLTKAEETIAQNLPPEIVSAEIRIALNSLDEIVGKTHTEDILGRIFSKFCIGK